MKRKVTCLVAVAAQIVAGLSFLLCALLYLPLALVAKVLRAGIQKIVGKTEEEPAISVSPISLTTSHHE